MNRSPVSVNPLTFDRSAERARIVEFHIEQETLVF
jgi:hypothetical protein